MPYAYKVLFTQDITYYYEKLKKSPQNRMNAHFIYEYINFINIFINKVSVCSV